MICPQCGHDNLPGIEECGYCGVDLTQLDRPTAHNRIERSLMEDPVSVLRPKKPVTVSKSTPLGSAISLMLEADLGSLLVVDDNGRLLGVLSERDLLTRVAGVHENYSDLAVGAVMTSTPVTVLPSDTLAFALHKMDVGGYRHLPVTKEDHPVGVVSVRDMLRHITRLCK